MFPKVTVTIENVVSRGIFFFKRRHLRTKFLFIKIDLVIKESKNEIKGKGLIKFLLN